MEEIGLGKGRGRGAQPQAGRSPLLTSLSPQTGIPKRGSTPQHRGTNSPAKADPFPRVPPAALVSPSVAEPFLCTQTDSLRWPRVSLQGSRALSQPSHYFVHDQNPSSHPVIIWAVSFVPLLGFISHVAKLIESPWG